MPAPARFRPVCTTLRKHRPERDLPTRMVTVRDRLIREALKSPEHDDLTLEQVGQMVDHSPIYTTSGTVIPLDYPWWYGGLAKDRPVTPATEAQLAALARARQRKSERSSYERQPFLGRQAEIASPRGRSYGPRCSSELTDEIEKPYVKEDEGPR